MIARTTAVIEPGGVLGELACAPPLTLRQVHGVGQSRTGRYGAGQSAPGEKAAAAE